MRGLWLTVCGVVCAVAQSVQAQPSELQLSASREICSRYGYSAGTDAFAKCVQDKVEGAAPAPMSEEERRKAQLRCESQMRGDSGGGFGSWVARSAKCKDDPYAHLKQTAPQRGVTCRRNFDGSVSCDPD